VASATFELKFEALTVHAWKCVQDLALGQNVDCPVTPTPPASRAEAVEQFNRIMSWCRAQEPTAAGLPENGALTLPRSSHEPGAQTVESTTGGQPEDLTAYRPASEFLVPGEYPKDYNDIHDILEKHSWIRRRRPISGRTGKPHPRRLNIHAGDWAEYKKLAMSDANLLDVDTATAEALLEAEQRKADEKRKHEERRQAPQSGSKGAPKNNFQDYPTGSQTQVVARRGLSV
jgi:hypothetical protein